MGGSYSLLDKKTRDCSFRRIRNLGFLLRRRPNRASLDAALHPVVADKRPRVRFSRSDIVAQSKKIEGCLAVVDDISETLQGLTKSVWFFW